MCLILRQKVAKIVDARLVEGLERLEDKRGLRLPLLRSILKLGGGSVDLSSTGLAALPAQLFGFDLSFLEVSGYGRQIGGDSVHVMNIASILKVAQWMLNLLLDSFSQQGMGVSDGLNGIDDFIPGGLEDTISVVSNKSGDDVMVDLKDMATHPSSDCEFGALKEARRRRPWTY